MSRTRRLRRSTVLLLVAVLLLAVGTYAAYFSPLLVVRQVAVAGQQQVSVDAVRAAAAVPMGTPLARQDVQGIAERVTRIPAVQSASVTRRWPSTLTVAVTERTAVLAVRGPDGFVLVDAAGVAYDRSPSVPSGAVAAEVDPGNAALLREVGLVAGALPTELSRMVTRLSAPGAERITLRLKGGVGVNWGDARESELKAQIVLALLREAEPSTSIDVSSPNNPALR